MVDITSHFEDGTRIGQRFQIVIYEIPRGCCATYFPEANVLVPLGQIARGSRTPASKSVVVTLQRFGTIAPTRHAAGAPLPWHFFHFLPLPQGHGSLRPGVGVARTAPSSAFALIPEAGEPVEGLLGIPVPNQARTTSRGK